MLAKPHILAVDDETFVLDILEDDLLDAGFEVVRAENGQSALDKIKEMARCDAVVLDRMMPDMDGITVLKQLKSSAAYNSIPVILHTADGQPEHIQESLNAGAYSYLIKPYNEKLLISVIQAAMRGEKA